VLWRVARHPTPSSLAEVDPGRVSTLAVQRSAPSTRAARRSPSNINIDRPVTSTRVFFEKVDILRSIGAHCSR
jgi:hypothetical protein